MGSVGRWLEILPSACALLLVLYVPGRLVLTQVRMPSQLRWVIAPPITLGIVGVAALVYGAVGVPWNWLSFLLACGLALGVAAAVGYVTNRSHVGFATEVDHLPWARYVLLASIVAVLASVVPALVLADPFVPNPGPDPMYHYHGVRAIQETGNASIFGAMDANYGLRTRDITYPATWHAVVALVAGHGMIVPVSNALAYLVIPVVYVGGLVALARVAFPTQPVAPALAASISIAFPVFPLLLTVWKAFWPHALGLALLPAVLAGMIWAYRALSVVPLGQLAVATVPLGVTLLAAIAGVAFTHPSVFFTLVVMLMPYGVVLGYRAIRRRVDSGESPMGRSLPWIYVVLVLAALAVVFTNKRVLQYILRQGDGLVWDEPLQRLASSVMLWGMGPNLLISGAVLAALLPILVYGLVLLLRPSETRWIAYAWIIQWLVILGAYFPLGPVSAVAGIWYSDPYRLFASQAPVMILLLTRVGVEALGWLGRSELLHARLLRRDHARGVALVGLVTVAALGWAHVLRIPSINPALRGESSLGTILSSEEELEMIVDVAEELDGAVVLGDGPTGAAYLPVYGDVVSVFTQVNRRDLDVDGNYLAEHFSAIHSDPHVCEIVRHYGITHFYEDAPVTYAGVDRTQDAPGLYGVDKSEGFTLLDEAGEARVWRIDACGSFESGAETWWDLGARFYPMPTS